jgi:hypothetical protein
MPKTLSLQPRPEAPPAPSQAVPLARLDLDRQYGVVYGDPAVSFIQDGKQFDKKGKEIPSRI